MKWHQLRVVAPEIPGLLSIATIPESLWSDCVVVVVLPPRFSVSDFRREVVEDGVVGLVVSILLELKVPSHRDPAGCQPESQEVFLAT